MINTRFFFNEIDSTSMGISLVNLDSGMVESPVFGSRNIINDRIPRKDYNYFHGLKKEPLAFSLTFAPLQDLWTDEKRYVVFDWLVQNDYCKFYTIDKPDRLYYIICTSEGNLMTNGCEQGYITMEFENLFPYPISPVYTQTYDLSTITSSTIIQIENRSNVNKYYYPEIEFELRDTNTNFKLQNLTVGGEIIEFQGLQQNEIVYVNNENKQILSNISGSYPIAKCVSKQWLRLAYGINNIQITGKCILRTRMQFPLYI